MSTDTALEQNGDVPGRNALVPPDDRKIDTAHHDEVVQEARSNSSETLEKLFASYQSASDQTRKEISALNSPEWASYQSRALLLKKNAEHAPKMASLTDRVRKLGL